MVLVVLALVCHLKGSTGMTHWVKTCSLAPQDDSLFIGSGWMTLCFLRLEIVTIMYQEDIIPMLIIMQLEHVA